MKHKLHSISVSSSAPVPANDNCYLRLICHNDLDYNFTSVIDTGTAGTLESLTYSYLGLAGQLKQVTDTLNSANNISFTLDSKGRMNGQGISPSGFTYFYDANDNRTSIHAASGNTDYAYNPGTSQLATITFGGVTTTLATNALGNITGFTPGYGANAVTTLTYSKANRLASVANAGGTLASYTYDGFGNRILKSAGAATTTYQYAPDGTLLAEKTGSAETDYAYLNDRPLATLTGTAFTYLHGDRFGTPQMGTNAAQGVLWSANYLIYGDPFHGTPGTNLRLPGQYYDAESGFHHNGFRDYVPQLGRYLESDPIGIGYWRDMNIYGYAQALPMSYIDPEGLAEGDFTCDKTGFGCFDLSQVQQEAIKYKTEIAQAVQKAINILSGSCKCGAAQEYTADFAKINPALIDTNNWLSVYSIHGTAFENTIPGSKYVIKIYGDPRRGNVGAITTPTGSITHYFQAVGWLMGQPVNGQNAEAFLNDVGGGLDTGCLLK